MSLGDLSVYYLDHERDPDDYSLRKIAESASELQTRIAPFDDDW